MKKTVCAILIFAVCLSFAALSGCTQSGKRIAFFVYDGSDTFISEMMGYLTDRVPDGVTFEIRDAGNSQAVQNQQILELIDNGGFSLFIINAVDRLACSSIVEKCGNEGIPVIFFNREPLDDALTGNNVSNANGDTFADGEVSNINGDTFAGGKVSNVNGDAFAGGEVFYVGADADSLGKKQADMVAEVFAGSYFNGPYDINGDGIIQLVILKGEQGHQDAEKRTENCVNRLKELGYQVDVLAIEVADWNRQDAYDAMWRLHKQYLGIELVFANNDDMALGAIDYLIDAGVFTKRGKGYEQPFLIVGVDGTAVGLEAIEKGLLYGTVNNDSVKQSDAILSLAEYIIEGKALDSYPYTITNGRYIYIDGDVITRDNLSDYYSGN